MPESRVRRNPGARLAAALAAVAVLLFLAAPGQALGRGAAEIAAPAIHDAAVPGDERCADQSPDPDTGQKPCEKPILSVSNVVPILGIVVAAGVLALVGAYLVLRRRASAPFVPADAGEWWLCPKCGATNVVGSARCYSCGTWQR